MGEKNHGKYQKPVIDKYNWKDNLFTCQRWLDKTWEKKSDNYP